MGGCKEPHFDMHADKKELFDKMHGEDEMAVDKLKEGIDSKCRLALYATVRLSHLTCI